MVIGPAVPSCSLFQRDVPDFRDRQLSQSTQAVATEQKTKHITQAVRKRFAQLCEGGREDKAIYVHSLFHWLGVLH